MKISISINKWTIGIILLLIVAGMLGFYIYNSLNSDTPNEPINKIDTESKVNSTAFHPQEAFPVPEILNYSLDFNDNEPASQLSDVFRPIGWSKNGRFAYVVEPADEACGCYFFTIIIQDLITDKVLWKWDYNSGGESSNNAQDINSLWKQKSAEFTRKLNSFQITPIPNMKFRSLPIVQDEFRFEFPVKNKMSLNPDIASETISNTSIYMYRNGKSLIRIFNENYLSNGGENSEVGSSSILTNKIHGYLSSPFENRVAIFYAYEMRGYEGPPNVVKFSIIGCDLDYKK